MNSTAFYSEEPWKMAINSLEDLLHDLSLIALALHRLQKDNRARVLYDELSGSLFWTDEWPQSPLVLKQAYPPRSFAEIS